MGDSGAFLCRAIEESNIEMSGHRKHEKGEKQNQFNMDNERKTIKVFWTLQIQKITYQKLINFTYFIEKYFLSD